MKLKLLAVGKVKDSLLEEKSKAYLRRLVSLVSFTVEEVREFPVRKGLEAKIGMDHEANLLQERLGRVSFYVALDEHGKQKTTLDWVDLFRKWENESRREITFILGGAYGLSEAILRGAHERLALSKLTFTHEMARLIFFEQVYRVYTVLRNIPYHHGQF